jgi:hypothetical protein
VTPSSSSFRRNGRRDGKTAEIDGGYFGGCAIIPFEDGFVYLLQEAPWLDAYVAELTSIPETKYDDQVDSATQALTTSGQTITLSVWARL